MSIIEIKEYDTLRIACQYQDPNGNPLPISDVDIESDMTTIGGMDRTDLAVEIVSESIGSFVLTSNQDRLIPRNYSIDIIFIDKIARTRVTSETMTVRVLRSVTKPSEVVE